VAPERLLEELVTVAGKLGVDVRVEPLRVALHLGSGGMIRLKGKTLVLLDSKSPVVDRLLTLADALVPLAGASEEIYMAPEARELLDAARAKREGRIQPVERRALAVKMLSKPKPGLRRARPRQR